ncbi:MAG TPA: hypothetical protein DIW51_11655 [Rhodospirillaceae bacterium]|nr:hypothetical protein [Rhodospirillaceae bacterium]
MRSGVLTSVHAFATDPTRGVFILILLIIVIGGSLALYAWRGPQLISTGLFQPISREGGLLFNNLVMATATAVVLLGTLYPLLLDAVGGGKVSVGPPFFNAVFIPIMLPMIVVMAVGPMLNWKRGDWRAAVTRLWPAMVAALLAAVGAWALVTDGPFLGIVGMALAAWLAVGTLVELTERLRLRRDGLGRALGRLARQPRASWGMTLAHLGLAVTIAGMTGAGAWVKESIQVMAPGDTVTLAGYEFRFDGAQDGQGPNYAFTAGHFTVSKGGRVLVVLDPEKRVYNVSGQPTTEAGIEPTLLGDIYAVIGDRGTTPEGKPGFVTRLYFNPLVAWMWGGLMIMIAGGALSLSDRRHRVGAPARRAAVAQTAGAD